MKKIKVMFTAVGVLAIVGGALAFNERKFGVSSYCGLVNGAIAGSPNCPLIGSNIGIVPNSNSIYFCTIQISTPCSIRACLQPQQMSQ